MSAHPPLPTIGNDIVDLAVVEPPLHPRFISRVCSERERGQGIDGTTIWMHWAAKEAAYKAVKRHHPEIIFSPVCFELNRETGTVTTPVSSLPVTFNCTSDYVAAVCASTIELLQSPQLMTRIEPLAQWQTFPHADSALSAESKAVRAMILHHIATSCQIDPSRLKIESRDKHPDALGTRIPVLLVDGHEQESLLSFSHHGGWVMGTVGVAGLS